MRLIENLKLSSLLASVLLLCCGCQGGDRPSEQTDVQTAAGESDTPLDQTETANEIEQVDEDIERGMQADYFERKIETEVLQPIEKATEVPAGPVTDKNSPDDQ